MRQPRGRDRLHARRSHRTARWAVAWTACLAAGAASAQLQDALAQAAPVAQEDRAAQPAPRLALAVVPGLPTVGTGPNIGVRWQQPLQGTQTVDITAWRRVTPAPDALTLVQQREPAYGARVEMKIAAPRRGLLADTRFIGMQLDGGGRIGLRRKDGHPTLYYRSDF